MSRPRGSGAEPFALVHACVFEDTRLTKTHLATYAALCKHAYRDRATVYHRALAHDAHVSYATVRRATQALRDCGYLTWEDRVHPQRGSDARAYTILPLTAHYAAKERKDQQELARAAHVEQGGAHQDQGGCSPMTRRLFTVDQGPAHSEHPHKDQDSTRPMQDLTKKAPVLPPSLVALYTRLIGHEPTPAMTEIIARHLAEVGEMTLSGMMLEAMGAVDVITPAALDVARRKLQRTRRGKVISLPPPAGYHEPPPLPEEHNLIWRAVLAELRYVLTPENFMHWLAPTRVVEQTAESLTITVPTEFHANWLEAKLRGRVNDTLRRLGYADISVSYVVSAVEASDHA